MQAELDFALKEYVGRETPLYFAERLSQHYKRCGAHERLETERPGAMCRHRCPNVSRGLLVPGVAVLLLMTQEVYAAGARCCCGFPSVDMTHALGRPMLYAA